ncbi:MAG: right-handed parallel beta-helix repeat-containing protein [Phycisphaerae bacterium]|jgi:predicted outer membrane repeat protein
MRISLVFLTSLLALSAFGADRLVPSQYATIQQAVDAAITGDNVVISPGIYSGQGNRDIDLHGKSITVRSTNPNDPDIVNNTVIDCYDFAPVSHSGFIFQSISSSEISGLTVMNAQTTMDGGGMRFMNCGSPIISNCVITYNDAQRGAGIFCQNAAPIFTNCTISENWSTQSGGGVYCRDSSPKFFNCDISGNLVMGTGPNLGGGFYFEGNNNPTFENTWITDNLATSDGGGLYSQNGLTIERCIISGNISQRSGGAIFCNTVGTLNLSDCVITGNSATSYGGAISAGDTIITNCTFSGNRSYQPNNSTIYAGLSIFKITNSIIWGETPNIIQSRGTTPDIRYSDIQWPYYKNPYIGRDVTGNLAIDPYFTAPGRWQSNNWISGDYHLSIDSVCINTGDPNNAAYIYEKDLDGQPRIKLGRIDMGAYEGDTHPMDFDQNGIVDFVDFAKMAEAWMWQAKWHVPSH